MQPRRGARVAQIDRVGRGIENGQTAAAAIRIGGTAPLVLYFSTHSTYLCVSRPNYIGANDRRKKLWHQDGGRDEGAGG
jgi:hypothetical protein